MLSVPMLWLCGSFLVSQWLFHRGSPQLCSWLCPSFIHLPISSRTEWNSRIVSTIHALVVSHSSLYVFLFDEAIIEDPVWGDPAAVKLNVAITTGYLLSDLVIMFSTWEVTGDKLFVLHHLAALYAYSYVLDQGLLPYFANFRLLSEFSTPCVNQRWFFKVLRYPKTSVPNLLNGALMAGVFFLVRLAVLPVYYYRVLGVFGTPAYYRLPVGGRVAWIASSVCLDVLNLLWMWRIWAGGLQVLRSKTPAPHRGVTRGQPNSRMD
ncbi:TLC domain-containing protein 4-B-like [Engraulis encrasicolus]|uniref:TLC domain-containing protein 4-B-like n=1 Tax=Engraulis encrasicolus TaxID=184585 RepID=UPI002FD27FAA